MTLTHNNATFEVLIAIQSELKSISQFTSQLTEIGSNVKQLCEKRNTYLDDSSVDWSNISKIWKKTDELRISNDLDLKKQLVQKPIDHSTPLNLEQVKVNFGTMFDNMSRDINIGSIIAEPDNSCQSQVANNPQVKSPPTLPFPLQNEQDLARPQVMPIEMARTQGSPKNLKTHTIITIPPTPPPPTSIPTFQTHIRSMPPPNPIPTTFYPTQKTFATKTSQSRRKFTTLPGHPAPIYNPIPQIIPPSQQHLAAVTPQSRPMHTIIPIPPSPIFNPIPLNSKPIPQNAPPRATKTQTGPLACPTQSIPVPPTKWLNKNNKVPALS